MRDSARKPLGWSARRKPFGDSFVSCLLTCIVVIGGSVWAYFHFFENRHLDNWDTGHNLAEKDPGSEAMNHYRKKMIVDVLARHDGSEDRLKLLYKQCEKDEISYDDFNQESEEIERELRETMNDLKARSVPPKYHKAHLKMAEAIHNHWITLNSLREYIDAEEPNIKESTLKTAKESWIKGRNLRKASKKRYGSV